MKALIAARIEGRAAERHHAARQLGRHPEHGVEDLPRSRYGFPAVPGVLTAARRPFRAAGLGLAWYALHGNHDNMPQGTLPAAGWQASRSARSSTRGGDLVQQSSDRDAGE